MAKKFISYLSQLRFDPKLYDSFWSKYIINIRFVILLIFIILSVGISSLLTLPRRLNPEVKLTIVTVTTVLPGAGPSDVESLITIPLEDKLTGISGLDTITSSSQNSVSSIVMQFKSGVDKDKARSDSQTAVSSVTALPSDAQTPKVTALDFENQPIWNFLVYTKADTASLMRYADILKTDIERIPDVDHVSLSGFDTQEIQIIFNVQKLKENNINPIALSTLVKNSLHAFPSGSINTGENTFSLAIDAQATSVDDIRNIHLNINNQPIKLGDVANVIYRSKPDQKASYIASKSINPSRAVGFAVFKSSSADIDTTVKKVEKLVNDEIGINNGNFRYISVMNTGEEIGKQLTDLVGEFESTIILVFINLLLFLGIRQAAIACMTIPLTFLMSFAWMGILGQTVNFISLFALLLAFGTSIDDTIVTVSAMTAYFRTGRFTPHQTGILVWRDFIVPIWTTTVTTVWAFLPLILTSGILGEFLKPIPVVVASTMYTSTAVAWFITLPMMIFLLKPQFPKRVKIFFGIIGFLILSGMIIFVSPKSAFLIPVFILYLLFLAVTVINRKTLVSELKQLTYGNRYSFRIFTFLRNLLVTGVINTEKLSNKYQDLILRILASKRGRRITLICLLIFTISSYSLIPLGLVKNEFFPKTNADTLYINLDLSPGTNLANADSEARNILNMIRNTSETKAVQADIGSGINASFNETSNPSSILFTMILIPKEQRKTDSSIIAKNLRDKFANYSKGKLSVIEIGSGPPAGADVQIKLLGDDLSILNQYADKVESYLSGQPGVVNVDKSVKSGTSKLVFVPDKAKIAANGLTVDNLGFWLRLSASGFSVDTVKFNDKSEDINIYSGFYDLTPDNIGIIPIPTNDGYIPLLSLGNLRLENNPTVINREGGQRTISVTASVLPGFSVSQTNANLGTYANDKLSLPAGYTWQTGGVNEENQKSVTSIFRAMGLSFILIMVTMVIEFNSYRQAGLILSLIPLAISGVFIIFGLTGTPLSFPALVGVMALFGVVVTNAMFIVEKINQNRKEGMNLDGAIGDAAQGRLEPILLTSLTSILGLIPITLANPLWRGLGGAIISGLLFSGIIMLLYVPIMYHTLYRHQTSNET